MNGAENLRMAGTRQLVNGSPAIPTPITVIQDGTISKVKAQQIITTGGPIMSNKQVVTTASPITVPMQAGMQIVNVRPNQTVQMTPTRGISPRMIVNQISGVRASQTGQPITLQAIQGLAAGTQGHLIVKTETGQLQLLRVNTSSNQLTSNGMAVAPGMVVQQGNNTFRIPTQTTNTVSTLPNSTSTVSQVVQTIMPSATATSSTLSPVVLGTNVLTNSIQTNQAQSTPAVGTQTVSAESAKSKCKNFLSTLLRLASEQRAKVAQNVYHLIQGLIDGEVEPEVFTEELQRDLNSNPQPCLVPFLKKTLPYLRASLAKGELSIEGVRPPPLSSVQPVTGMTTVIPSMVNIVRSPAPVQRLVTPLTNTIIHRPVTPQAVNSRMSNQVAGQLRVGGKIVSTNTVKGLQTVTTSGNLSSTTLNSMASNLGKVTTRSTKDDKKSKDKLSNYNTFGASSIGDDDINDVAAMGGVNLGEESQRILDSTGFVGTHIRSVKDEMLLSPNALHQRVKQICNEQGLDEPSKDVLTVISHATQERLRYLVQKLAVYAEHRLDLIKSEPRYDVIQDVKGQLRFLEDLHKVEKKRKDEQEREILLRAAKSRNRTEDPEQAKLKAKAKEMQRVEMEEMRQRDANLTALKALQGPRKRQKLDNTEESSGGTFSGTFTQKTMPLRPRIKRVNMRDMMFLMEQEKDLNKSQLLYRTYLK